MYAVLCLVILVVSSSLPPPWTVAHEVPLSMGILQARILEWVAIAFSRGSSRPRDRRSPTLQVDSLPSELPGKPMNTGVGSPSRLQGIFLIQESNLYLLHCRQILYELSYQGSLMFSIECFNKKHSLSTKVVIYMVVGSASAEVKGMASVLLCRLRRKGWKNK